MVYTRTMFTALLASGAASSIVVSAAPIDMNSGPSLVTTMASSRTSTSTSTSIPSAAPSTLFDNAINSDDVLDPLGPASLSQPLDRVPLKFEHQRRAPSIREVRIEPQIRLKLFILDSFFHQSTRSSHDGANARQAGQGQNPSSSSQHGVNGEPLHNRSSEEERLSSPEQQANRFLDNLADELSNCPPPGPSALEANRLQQLESSTTQNPTRSMLTGAGDHARGVQTADHSSDDLPGATSIFSHLLKPQWLIQFSLSRLSSIQEVITTSVEPRQERYVLTAVFGIDCHLDPSFANQRLFS
ncbi:hypothetical protein F5880DRAFT_1597769 [Lentinula raphanica]|nr:hypothetical protein F5880DRAFT_1597769 [Lentinula raphanica]